MTKKNKDGVKKHSPHQTETEPSIVSQVPKDLQAEFLQGLVDLAQKRKGSPSQPQEESSQDRVIIDPHPTALFQQIKNLTEDYTKSLEGKPQMEESEYLEKTNDGEFEVCYGDLMDGLSIDIVKYSGIEPLTDDQSDKLWSETTDISLVEMCDNCELIETGERDAPGASTIFYTLVTEDEKAFKSELRETIKSIIGA